MATKSDTELAQELYGVHSQELVRTQQVLTGRATPWEFLSEGSRQVWVAVANRAIQSLAPEAEKPKSEKPKDSRDK